MKMIYMVGMFVIWYSSLIFFFAFIPYLVRKTVVFGVSIPEEIFDDTEVSKLRKSYSKTILGFGIPIAIITMLFSLGRNDMIGIGAIGLGVLVEIIMFFCIYLKFHNQMKSLKDKNQWTKGKSQVVVVDTEFNKKGLLVSPLWFLINIIVIICTVVAGYLLYDKIPNQIPLKYNINGDVIRWASKSYRFIFFGPTMQLFITILMGAIYLMIGKAKQQVDAQNPEISIEQNKIFRYRWSAYMVFISWMLVGMFAYIQFGMLFLTNKLSIAIPMISAGIIVAVSIAIAVTTGQGGSRVKITHAHTGKEINRDDDSCWKLGILYFNPEDPALFLEKRFGIGWTINWARPMSWVIVVVFIVFIAIMQFLMRYLTK